MAPESMPVYGGLRGGRGKKAVRKCFALLTEDVCFLRSSKEMGKHFFLLCDEVFLPGVNEV